MWEPRPGQAPVFHLRCTCGTRDAGGGVHGIHAYRRVFKLLSVGEKSVTWCAVQTQVEVWARRAGSAPSCSRRRET